MITHLLAEEHNEVSANHIISRVGHSVKTNSRIYNHRHLSKAYIVMTLREFEDIKTVIISAVMIMDIALNSVVIAVIAKYPQLREDRATLFMFSLTISDFAAGCTCMPISAALCSNATPLVQNQLRYLPRIQAICLTLFSLNSLHCLCGMTVCKMVAILKPFHYEQRLTRSRCYIIIACIWLFAATYAIVARRFTASWDLETCMFKQSTASDMTATLTVGLIFDILVPLGIIVYATARILCVITRIHYEISTQVRSIGGSGSVAGASSSLTLQSIRSGKKRVAHVRGIVCPNYSVHRIRYYRDHGLGK